MWNLTLLIVFLQPSYFETGSWRKTSLGLNSSFHHFYHLGDISKFFKTLSFNFLVCKMGGRIVFIPWGCCESQWGLINISVFLALLGPSAQLPVGTYLGCGRKLRPWGWGAGEVFITTLGSTCSTAGCSAPATVICKEAAGGIKGWP